MTIYAVVDGEGNEVAKFESLEAAERALLPDTTLVQRMGSLSGIFGVAQTEDATVLRHTNPNCPL